MAHAIRTIGHEDRLSLVDHLDELRTRLIVSLAALAIAFGFALWQNHELLRVINKPLERQTQKKIRAGRGPLGQTAVAQQAVLQLAAANKQIAKTLADPSSHVPAATRAALAAEIPRLDAAVARVPRTPTGDKPVTLGIGEPFTTTILIALMFALLIALPIILFQLYGFVIPAFSPTERRIALPLMSAIPVLFACGVLFGYFVVLPAAVRFFQNFNSDQFNVLVQARDYYKFAIVTLLAMGLAFQVPVGILAATRAGIVTPRTLRKNRRYALVVCAAVAAFLPGDAITLVLETVPLYLLYEASILVATLVDRRVARREESARAAVASPPGPDAGAPPPGGPPSPPAPGGPGGPAGPAPEPPPDPSVQEIIDHVDRE